MSLLADCANIGHDLQIIPDTFFVAKASGDFGVCFYHPKIPFRLVVIKRDTEVFYKRQTDAL